MIGPREIVPFASAAEFERALDGVIAHVASDGLIAYPTETVYGFGSALNERALTRLAMLKPRDETKTFLLLAGDATMIEANFRLNAHARRLATEYWPGPLTLVLPPRGAVPGAVRSAGGGVAVRWTSHPGIQLLIRAVRGPITSTSANRSGLPTAVTAQEIQNAWRREVESGELLILDGGRLDSATRSTIVDCTGTAPRLIRQGAVSAERLRATVHDLVGEV